MTPNPAPVTTSDAERAASDLCYSTDEENYNYETLGDALDALDGDQGLEEGDVIYEGEALRKAPSYYFDVDGLLEDMGERAHDDAGEWADTFPDLPKDKVAELDAIIKAWLDANLSATFYTVLNTRKVVVTAEMIAEYRGPAPTLQGVADGDAVGGKSGDQS